MGCASAAERCCTRIPFEDVSALGFRYGGIRHGIDNREERGMQEGDRSSLWGSARLLVLGFVGVVVVLGLALVVMSIGRSLEAVPAQQVDALADSSDDCVVCHRRATPGIVAQYGHSTMAAAGGARRSCR